MAASVRLIAALALSGTLAWPAFPAGAQTTGTAATEQDEEGPTPAPLMVGAMAIASDADLSIERMALDVAVDRVTYTYGFKNRGKAELQLAASVSMPDLEVNTEGTTIYVLPTKVAENPVGLSVTSGGAPVATTATMQALALGVDRLADLRAAKLPLLPFGAETDKALAGIAPGTLARLVALGLVTPRDQAEPDTPLLADWTLHTVHSWMQTLPVGATTEVKVTFQPVKAVYGVRADGLPGFEALKDQVCLTPQVLAAAKALLKGKDDQLEVDDLTLANDGPARWLDNPPGTVSVTKPKPDAVVTFCGIDNATAGQAVVKGKLPGSADAPGLRVLIFSKG